MRRPADATALRARRNPSTVRAVLTVTPRDVGARVVQPDGTKFFLSVLSPWPLPRGQRSATVEFDVAHEGLRIDQRHMAGNVFADGSIVWRDWSMLERYAAQIDTLVDLLLSSRYDGLSPGLAYEIDWPAYAAPVAPRYNPTLLSSRISVDHALSASTALWVRFERAAAVAALYAAGWPPDDPDLQLALVLPDAGQLLTLLAQCGSPECLAAASTLTGLHKREALVGLAPLALPFYQQALFAEWDTCKRGAELDALLTYADPRIGIWVATQVVRTVLASIPTRETRPRRAVEAVEACVGINGRSGFVDVGALRVAGAAVAAAQNETRGGRDATRTTMFAIENLVNAAVAAVRGTNPNDITYYASYAVTCASDSVANMRGEWGTSAWMDARAAAGRSHADLIRSIAACSELVP